MNSGHSDYYINKNQPKNMALNLTLRKVYLYLFAIIGLILIITGSVSFINLGLKTYVFKQADTYPIYVEKTRIAPNGQTETLTPAELAAKQAEEEEQQAKQRTSDRQRQAANALAQLIVGLPLYAYHWMLIKKENQV